MTRQQALALLANTFSMYTRAGINKKGDLYGIELENECLTNLSDEDYDEVPMLGFTLAEDHSLRGKGFEFISKPMKPVDLKNSLSNLCDKMSRYEWTYSRRTSTHVHVNFADKTCLDVLKFLLVYYTLEPVLFSSVKPTRLSNTFCMPSEDVLNAVIQSIEEDKSFRYLTDENVYKYSSLNVVPLYKIGTVECRIFHATWDYKELANWLNTLRAIKKYSEGFDSLTAVKKDFLDTPAEDFVEKVLGNQLWKHYIKLAAKQDANLAELVRSGYAYARRLVTLQKIFDKAKEELAKPVPKLHSRILDELAKAKAQEPAVQIHGLEPQIMWHVEANNIENLDDILAQIQAEEN